MVTNDRVLTLLSVFFFFFQHLIAFKPMTSSFPIKNVSEQPFCFANQKAFSLRTVKDICRFVVVVCVLM